MTTFQSYGSYGPGGISIGGGKKVRKIDF